MVMQNLLLHTNVKRNTLKICIWCTHHKVYFSLAQVVSWALPLHVGLVPYPGWDPYFLWVTAVHKHSFNQTGIITSNFCGHRHMSFATRAIFSICFIALSQPLAHLTFYEKRKSIWVIICTYIFPHSASTEFPVGCKWSIVIVGSNSSFPSSEEWSVEFLSIKGMSRSLPYWVAMRFAQIGLRNVFCKLSCFADVACRRCYNVSSPQP